MKTIKIKMLGFWPSLDLNNNFIINKLKKSFNVVFSDNPDYIIASCFTKEFLKYQDCVKIFYTGENICPDFNVFDYAIGFEYLDFSDRYIRYTNYMIPEEYGEDYELMLKKHLVQENFIKTKENFCSFVVSKGSGNVMSEREQIFHKLCKYKKVNSGGRFLNNIGEPNGVKDKLDFQSKHKFAIAFENSSHVGYTTEKIIQAFAAKTIPVYFGDPNIDKVFNKKSFINCHDFSNFDEVVEFIKKVDSDDDLYMNMIKTPAMLQSVSLEDENMKLEKFLIKIFEQPKENAFRRDRIGYGKLHCDNLLDLYYKNSTTTNKWKYLKKLYKIIKDK